MFIPIACGPYRRGILATQDRGEWPVLSLMVKRIQAKRRRLTHGHLRMVGILKSTQKRYAYALLCFFKWRRIQKRRHPKTYDEVDNLLGEYVNYLFQAGKPQYLGYDVVSAMRRYCPQSKASLNTAKTFLANWTSIIERRKALPLSPSMVRAMAGFALLRGQTCMGLLLLLSFLWLLRVSEALCLEARDFTFLSTRDMLIFLRDTKTSRQQNSRTRPRACASAITGCARRCGEYWLVCRVIR